MWDFCTKWEQEAESQAGLSAEGPASRQEHLQVPLQHPPPGGPRGGLASWTRMGDNVSYCDCIALTAFSPFSKLRPHHRCWLDGCCRVPQRSAPHTFSHASVDRRPPTEIETISPAPNSSSCFHEFSTRFDRTSSLLFSLRGKLVQDSVLTPEAPDPRTT